ncbi:unnamed protein product [Trichobilharzia szidati]|nr:unnamed protein product [Trichobilharzia szidati]
MAAQPETLKFSPQWIRDLSDGAFNSRRHSSRSPTEDVISSRCPVSSSNHMQKHSSKSTDVSSLARGDRKKDLVSDNVGQPVWSGESMRSTESGCEADRQGQSSGEPSKQYSQCMSSDSMYARNRDANQAVNSTSQCDDVSKYSVQWSNKSTLIPPEPCWHMQSDSTDVMLPSKTGDPIRLGTSAHSVSSPSTGSSEVPYVGSSILSGNPSLVNNATLNITPNPLNDGMAVSQSYGNNNTDPYGQGKRAVSAYYGVKDPEKILDSSMNPNTIWMQQHIWSKSVPQHLHGLNPTDSVSNPVSNFCGVSTTETSRHTSSSVPDVDQIHNFFPRLPAFDRVVQSNSNHPYSMPSNAVQNPSNIMEDERGFLRPDGSDHPDEHMWLYEDPQGRTQGSFSDAQMNEWLMAGIYFTPTLRIRRKCDDTFSTLASYTQLFERVPFVPGPRIPPIQGGINQAMLSFSNSSCLNKINIKSSENAPVDLTSCGNSNSHDHCEGNLVNPGIIGTNSVDVSRVLLSESQRQLYQHLTDFQTTASNITTNASGTSVSSCQLSEESLHNMKLRNPLYGVSNTSAPVSTPISLLNNSISNLRLGDSMEADFKSVLDNSHNLQQQRQPVTSASNFMNLSSLAQLNQSFPSFNFQLPVRPQAENGTTIDDLTATANSFLSPGFWSILTQYLNLNPPPTNQTSTPMQQLAETAQLAAQLAALVGSHSPDQTPMQPAQALALAQFLMNRGVGLGVGNTAPNCSNVGPNNSRKDESFDEVSSANSSTLNNSGSCGVNERRQESQTQWPTLSSSVNRNSSHTGDGRYSSQNKTSDLSYGKNCTNSLPENSSNVNSNVHAHRSTHINKSQSTVTKSSISPRSTNAKSKSLLDSSSSEPVMVTSPDKSSSLDNEYNRSQQNGRSTKNTEVSSNVSSRGTEVKQNLNNLSRTGSTTQSKTKAKQTSGGHLERGQVSDARFARLESDSGHSSNTTGVNNASANNQKSLNNSISKANNIRSPTKAVIQNNNSPSPQSNTSGNLRSSETTFSSVVSNSETDSDQTVEEELKKLTQWCQSRLSSMPMREKVDIPTVVELLATLDAPYEVERMVQTFLGETARTTQFVKDFLDRRRPFWQLHRKRREQASSMEESTGQNSTSQCVSTVRSSEKKKRANPNDSNTQRQNSNTCNGLSWTKSDSVHPPNAEQIQDNQVWVLNV